MSWIIIAVVLLAAFGPVLWILPSRRDRRLAALRAQAREEGLVVELRRLPKHNAEAHERVSAAGQVREAVVEVAAYIWGMSRKLQVLPNWRLQRGADDGPPPRAGWFYVDRPSAPSARASAHAQMSAVLEIADPLLSALPRDVLAVEVAPRNLLVYWLEGLEAGPQQVSAIAALLRDFEDRLLALDDRIVTESEGEDS